MSIIGPIRIVFLQSTSLCNLNCSYCYLSETDRQQNASFPEGLIEPVFTKLLKSSYLSKDGLRIVWHVGEPLALPVKYYETFISRLEKLKEKLLSKDFNIRYALQTNGTLINQAWCDFFQAFRIEVGVSCDGPDFLHDPFRQDWGGKESLSRVLHGLELLNKNKVDYGVLATVSPETFRHPEVFLNFFLKHKVSRIGLNPVGKIGHHSQNLLVDRETEDLYQQFLRRLLDKLEEIDQPIDIREFSLFFDMIFLYQSHFYQDVNNSVIPYRTLSIDHQGNFSTYSPELFTLTSKKYGDFILGNLLTDTLESVTQSNKFQRLQEDIQYGVNACEHACDYFSVCGGGSPSSKYGELGTFTGTETHDCRYRIKIRTDLLLEELEHRAKLPTS